MEFTLKAIQDAHSKYTGPDFPKLFKAFKDMGMTTNIVNIQQGTSTYVNTEKQTITTNGVKATHEVATSSHSSSVKDILKRHQNGYQISLLFVKKWHKLVYINGILILMQVLVHTLI